MVNEKWMFEKIQRTMDVHYRDQDFQKAIHRTMSRVILPPDLEVIVEHADGSRTDEDVKKILGEFEKISEGKRIRLDFSYNRLTIGIIPLMIDWLKKHQECSIQVKANNSCLNTFFAICTREDAVKFISDRRLNMSQTEKEFAIELLALRALEEDKILQIKDLMILREQARAVDNREHSERMKELEKQNGILNSQIAKLNRSVLHLTGWHRNQTDGFEDLITTALKRSLFDSGFGIIEIVDKDKRKVPKIDIGDILYGGIEWDGIIHCSKDGAEYLYLVESKTTITLAAIQDSYERIERTSKFITLCEDGKLPEKIKKLCADEKTANKELIKLTPTLRPLCRLWQGFKNSEIRLVIGALSLSPQMIDLCSRNRYITVCRNLDFFSVNDYSLSIAESEKEKINEKKYCIDDLNDEITLGDDFNDLETDL